jgi:hypothetical protein
MSISFTDEVHTAQTPRAPRVTRRLCQPARRRGEWFRATLAPVRPNGDPPKPISSVFKIQSARST